MEPHRCVRFATERHRYRRRLMEWAGLLHNDDRRDNQRSPLPEPCLRSLQVVSPHHLVRRAQGLASAVDRRIGPAAGEGPAGDEANRVAVTIHFLLPVLQELSTDHVALPDLWAEWQRRWAEGEIL